ncbi:MAG: HAD hydrolase-like protein [Calditrichaeota bacterium]|nr:HAD hydrolase-like protein [Calditrichota bacterium]
MIKAVVFDIGGVLAFDIWEHAFLDPEKGLAALLTLPRAEVREVGLKMWEDFAYKAARSDAEIQMLEEQYWQQFRAHFRLQTPTNFFISTAEKFIKPVESMLPLLKKLHENKIELAICSNNTEFFHKRLIDKLDFIKYFERENKVLSSRIGYSKTSPGLEMFRQVERVVSAGKNEILLIDDRIKNIERAIEFGMNAILFPASSAKGADYLEQLFLQMGVLQETVSTNIPQVSQI